MNFKNLLIIIILIMILLCFSSYSNKIYSKLTEFFNKADYIFDSDKKKSAKLPRYPISTYDDYSVDNRITDIGSLSLYNKRLNKLTEILGIVAREGRKKIKITDYSGEDIITTQQKSFNTTDSPVYKTSVSEDELRPILQYLFNKINSVKKDKSQNKLKLVKIDKNDVNKTETKDQVEYQLSFLADYYSNFYEHKINKKIKKIDSLIINCQILVKNNDIDDIFISEKSYNSKLYPKKEGLQFYINKLEIVGIESDEDYLSGYDSINSNYKFLNKPITNHIKNLNINEPEINNDFVNEYGSHKPHSSLSKINKKDYLQINKNYKPLKKKMSKKQKELLITDSIDSLLPDSYREPELEDSLYSTSSQDNTTDDTIKKRIIHP